MVSPAAGATASAPNINSTGIMNKLQGKLLSGGAQSLFFLSEFRNVPSAFALRYNRSAQKVTGLNWTSGLLETLKSLPNAVQWLIIPTAITGAAIGFGPIAATLATVAGLAVPECVSSLFEKLFPHEEEVIAQACKEKGIDIGKPDGTPDIRKSEGILA